MQSPPLFKMIQPRSIMGNFWWKFHQWQITARTLEAYAFYSNKLKRIDVNKLPKSAPFQQVCAIFEPWKFSQKCKTVDENFTSDKSQHGPAKNTKINCQSRPISTSLCNFWTLKNLSTMYNCWWKFHPWQRTSQRLEPTLVTCPSLHGPWGPATHEL